jgi:hypothetical protein
MNPDKVAAMSMPAHPAAWLALRVPGGRASDRNRPGRRE